MCHPHRKRQPILFRLGLFFALAFLAPGLPVSLRADDAGLSERQVSLANRYQQLEELLLRLAEVEAAENPERSALLKRAAKQSRDKLVLEMMRSASGALETEEFQKAVDSQEAATKELTSLLKLLLSEDRSKRIRDEKERLTKLAQQLKRTMRAQQSTRARTENGAEMSELEGEQESIGDRAEELADQLKDENELESDDSSSEQESSQQNSSESSESNSSENSDAQSDPQEQDPQDSDKPSDSESENESESESSESSENQSKPSDNPSDPSQSSPSPSDNPAESSESESEQNSQSQSQSSDSQQSQESQSSPSSNQSQTPEQQVEQQLRKAIEKMREAEKELKDAEREGATEKQREAEKELRDAIDQLEQILRQLREEEMQRELARLESRLRKMAAMQAKVYDDTVELAATPESQRNRQTDVKAGNLAFEQKNITLEADRAMLLLREEGSSVAFPEVITQISDDSKRVSAFLSETKIDSITQGIQKDILAALEEMIAAVQQAQRDLEQQRQQQDGQPQQGGQQEQPLVEAIAELKLIRTMETRVKSTTERYAGLIESGDQSAQEILPLLQDLAERQNRLYQITRDLVLKRNK